MAGGDREGSCGAGGDGDRAPDIAQARGLTHLQKILIMRRTTPFNKAMARTKDHMLHEKRQEEILLAAARVFKTRGFHAARTEDICAEAGLSAGTVFRHFPDKRAMIAAIAARELEHYQLEVQRLATREGLQWLTRLTEKELSELLCPTVYDLGADSWLELVRDEAGRKQLLGVDKKLRATLAAALSRGQKEGWVRKSLEPHGAVNVILAVFSGLAFDQEIGARTTTAATAATLSALFSHFIRA
ncbi:MAG: TetR/AcrR family transcriptional regulator [Burkholderiales bacterium]|jgi:TetR/AcrR family transcriptional repressor of uid operon